MDKRILWMTVLLSVTNMVLAANSIDTPPKNVTASVGDDVTFECGATLDDPPTDMLRWMKATTVADMTGGKMVWCSLPNKQQCPDITETDKYEIVDTYNLVIKNVQTTDAGIYWCDLVLGQTKGTGVLIVVEEPLAVPAPDMEENKETKLSCEVLFGAPPRVGWMFDSNTPRISAFIGTTDITGDILPTEHEGELGLTPWKVKWDYQHNATADHDNKQFICEVHTTNPYFKATASELIRVKHSVRGQSIYPRESVFTVGDLINCTASGFPDPEYKWNPLEGGGTIPQSGSSLLVEGYMVDAEQHWECIATNTVGDVHQVKEEIVFQVEAAGPDPGPTDPPITPASAGWKIAVGVCVPLVVIIVVVLIAFTFLRKKKPSGPKPPKPDKKNKKNKKDKKGKNDTNEGGKTDAELGEEVSEQQPTFNNPSFTDESGRELYAQPARPLRPQSQGRPVQMLKQSDLNQTTPPLPDRYPVTLHQQANDAPAHPHAAPPPGRERPSNYEPESGSGEEYSDEDMEYDDVYKPPVAKPQASPRVNLGRNMAPDTMV